MATNRDGFEAGGVVDPKKLAEFLAKQRQAAKVETPKKRGRPAKKDD